ncbi:linear amide C-N hydrolase, partial [Enterococcus faecium]
IVLQPTDNGAFVIYDSIGVVTNSPEYNYHLTNARNYIGMRNYAIKEPYTLKSGATLDPIEGGTSYGLLGIPGDFTSPSRFIRALYYSDNLQEFDSSEGIMQLYRAFQTVMIPRGIGHLGQSNSLSDFTHYWSGYDVTNLTMYVQPESTTSFTKYT